MNAIEENQTITDADPSITTSNNQWSAPGEFFNGTHYLLRHGSAAGNSSNDADGNLQQSNEIVVCVHGIGSYHTTFTRLADFLLLKGGYSVLQFDLIGRGFSEPSKNGIYGREEHLEQMHSLLQHLQLLKHKSLHIIGHSMGGCLSTLFTSQYGEYVKSLTLIAPAGLLGYFPIEFVKSWCPCIHGMFRRMLADRESARKAWRDDFYSHKGEALELENEWVKELDAVYDHNPYAFEAFWKSILEFPLTNIEEDIVKVAKHSDLPIMIFWGKKDKACSYSNLSLWNKIITNTRKDQTDKRITTKSIDLGAHGILSEFHQEMHFDIAKFLLEHSKPINQDDAAVVADIEVRFE